MTPEAMNTPLHVTVAAIARSAGRYLLVRERIEGKPVINQPAGHWEPDETLVEAVKRETLEETGWEFEPRGLVGIYQWNHPDRPDTFLRFAFHGDAARQDASRELDAEIEEVLWWDRSDISDASLPWRSPMVARCIEDFENGARFSLDCLRLISPHG